MAVKECDFCGKELEAVKEKQLNYQFKQHVLSKHPSKIEIKN